MDAAPADTSTELEPDPQAPSPRASGAVGVPDADGGHAPLLFLSHAGADTEAVRELKRRFEAAAERGVALRADRG